MATIDVKDASGTTVPIEKPLAPGRAAAAASRPVVLSTEDLAALAALATALGDILTKLPVNAAPMQQSGGSVAIASDGIGAGAALLVPKFAVIAASSSGDNAIVAAVPTKKIRVLAYNMVANGAVNAKFQSDATDKTGLKYFDAAGAGICAPFNPVGWFETVAGEKLDLNLSGAVAVGGELVYVEV